MIEFPLRQRIDLNAGWEFTRGRVSRKWLSGQGPTANTVTLPHCWNTDDTYQVEVNSYSGLGAYRREFQLPENTGEGGWRLRSDGFYGIGEVWLDGRRLDRFDAQYLGLDIPLPPSVAHGVHHLSIRLDNRWHRNVLPGRKDPDFLLYGGLVGGLRLEQNPHIGFEEQTVEIVCRPWPSDSEHIEFRSSISNPHGAAASATVRWTVSDDEDRPIVATERVAAVGEAPPTVVIHQPNGWSPEDPRLYWAEGILEDDSGTVDRIHLRFGITRAEFRPGDGFFLNGDRVDLHGANRHESIPGLGSALNAEMHRADVRLMKELGANFVRLSHYPQHPSFLDACDEIGVMVYPEIATWKSVRSSRGWRRVARRQMRDLIRRDRHHPSVILWGMGNESRSKKAYLELRGIARDLDPERPVTYAENHIHRARREKTIGIPDVWGVNYELDVLDEARESSALNLVVLSECCNHPTSIRGVESEELTQLAVIEHEWEIMADRPALTGHAVWSLADYATEYRNRTRRQTGLFDAWRQPKMAAELFRARFAHRPFISLFCLESGIGAPASRFRTELPNPRSKSAHQRLHVFSNCDGLRIHQHDRILASIDRTPHAIIPVDLSRGAVVVEGFSGGETIAQTIKPWSHPFAVHISRSANYHLTGEIQALDVRIVDDEGTTVPTWNGHVRATASGGAHLLAYTVSGEVLISRGEGRVFVRSTPEAVAPAVEARADDLQSGQITLGATDENSA